MGGNWTLDEHWKFVYDGYEQVEKLDGLNSDGVARKRIWGNGKIVADIHSAVTYYALGDANKNITEYLDSSGTIQAHYEYSLFGKITNKTGSMQDDFDFRFSSEVFDGETGLVYYNYRYYSPELGRWLSRDPINQMGSMEWWQDNEERSSLQKVLDDINRSINYLFMLTTIPNVDVTVFLFYIYSLETKKRYIIDRISKSFFGENGNLYGHASNNPIMNWDSLGLLSIPNGGFTDGSRHHCYVVCMAGGTWAAIIASIAEGFFPSEDWKEDLLNNALGAACSAIIGNRPGNHLFCKCCCGIGPSGPN